jgi:hypothetical protein
MYSITAVTNKHTAKLHHVGSLYILTYDENQTQKTVFLLAPTSVGVSPTALSEDEERYSPQNDVFYTFLSKAPWTSQNTE